MNGLTISSEILPWGWDEEYLYNNADDYFHDLIQAIHRAKHSILLESYIFEADVLGLRIIHALVEASLRGVEVKILVDGIGSAHWSKSFSSLLKNTPIEFRAYHPMPWNIPFFKDQILKRLAHYLLGLEWINKRNHRKSCVIDDELAFVGSYNITCAHLHSIGPEPAWRDSGIRIKGPQVRDIQYAFHRAWCQFPHIPEKLKWRSRLHNFKKHRSLVRLNDTPRLRALYYKDLCLRIKYAKEKIWITNPYFVPDRKLIHYLCAAAGRGVDVRIILPGVCDMALFPLINSFSSRELLKNGVKIYHYRHRVLHAKVVLIDHWSMLGSSNLNSRSLLHDLEMDIVTYRPKTHELLCQQFLTDQTESEPQVYEKLVQRFRRSTLFFPFLQLIRYWI